MAKSGSQSGFAEFLKSCDIYRRLPKDITEPSASGATSKFDLLIL